MTVKTVVNCMTKVAVVGPENQIPYVKRLQMMGYRLVESSDVFMSNYEYGSLKRLNLDYATLSRFNR